MCNKNDMLCSKRTILDLLIELTRHIKSRRRIQLGALATLMLVAAFAEIITIGAVVPFLTALTMPEKILDQATIRPILEYLSITRSEQLFGPLAIAFAGAAFTSGLTRFLLLWLQTRVGHAIGVDVSSEIYRRTLYQPYAVHVARNSSEVISGIRDKAHAIVGQTVLPLLTLLSATLILHSILIAILVVNTEVAISAFLGFGAVYALAVLLTRKRITISGARISHEQGRVLKILNEGLGGIREVLIDGAQESYLKTYRDADIPLRKAIADIQIIGASPRFIIEALTLMLFALLAYALTTRESGLITVVPTLGALALSAQRMLPMLQQAYSSWTVISGGSASLQDALDLLRQPLPVYSTLPKPAPLHFEREIRVTDLSFRYGSDIKLVLHNINLVIPHGARVGFIGSTGSGKSTLIDVLMGLLQPVSGYISIDGVVVTPENGSAWQAHIAHVPQNIFLADMNVAENIAFGTPINKVDMTRVRSAAVKAQIAETIDSWPQKYQTIVGERGVRLSGGQRQRIGIARALYKNADVIVLDEATSALDNDTEDQVMRAIESLGSNITLIMVAHRLTTLKGCSHIISLDNGLVRSVGTYEQIIQPLL